MENQYIRIHPNDNVVVSLQALPASMEIHGFGSPFKLTSDVPRGHKIAFEDIPAGGIVRRYGFPIGKTTEPVSKGSWIHSHNLKTGLEGTLTYSWGPAEVSSGQTQPPSDVPHFNGYRRKDGRTGTRNEIWIVNTVGCVNRSAERIASECAKRFAGTIDGFHAFSHPYGCSQLGDDLTNTQKVLAGLIRHPNAGGVLVLGLGCENNRMEDLLKKATGYDPERVRFFYSQDVTDEIEEGIDEVEALLEVVSRDKREPVPVTELVLGMKCGGSDGLSGITANPLLGRISDRITTLGGTSIITEVPEMFGAEQVLMNRAKDQETFEKIVKLINEFKEYFIRHNQPVYENPSPGNKDGGITTLEEKSLGAIQKGGTAIVSQVCGYGEQVQHGGLALVNAPGNDGVSCTAEVTSGATLLLFTTGRGTPLGFPVPTIKVSSNTGIFEKKPNWIDFNAGKLADGAETFEEATDRLWEFILKTASGEHQTLNEINNYREIAIWKEGVTL